MLKDEAAISSEKMKILDLKGIISSVVDDFNNIYNSKNLYQLSYQLMDLVIIKFMVLKIN